jgi:hypothetical protein
MLGWSLVHLPHPLSYRALFEDVFQSKLRIDATGSAPFDEFKHIQAAMAVSHSPPTRCPLQVFELKLNPPRQSQICQLCFIPGEKNIDNPKRM